MTVAREVCSVEKIGVTRVALTYMLVCCCFVACAFSTVCPVASYFNQTQTKKKKKKKGGKRLAGKEMAYCQHFAFIL